MVDIPAIELSKLNLPEMGSSIKAFEYLQIGYRLIYDVFNLEFFKIEQLSFCLWSGAKVLDIIAFKYISTLFTFALVFILVKLMNNQLLKCRGRKILIKHSVLKGLSAFLVLCYSQCTKVSFQILSREVLIGNNDSPDVPVTEYGGLPYFKRDHIIYAVPALICIVILVALPVLYLLIIPLLLQLLSMCGLSEHAAPQVDMPA